jgi:hypothetical protein
MNYVALLAPLATLPNLAPFEKLGILPLLLLSIYLFIGLYKGRVPRMPRMPRMPCRRLASLILKDAIARRIQEQEAR